MFSAKIRFCLSPKLAQKWPRKSLILLFSYFMCFRDSLSSPFKKGITSLLFLYKSKAQKCDINFLVVFSFLFKKEQTPLFKKANRSFIQIDLLLC